MFGARAPWQFEKPCYIKADKAYGSFRPNYGHSPSPLYPQNAYALVDSHAAGGP